MSGTEVGPATGLVAGLPDDYSVAVIPNGRFACNTYVVNAGSFSYLVDPGNDAAAIAEYSSEIGRGFDFAIATHGHFDHIGAVGELQGSGLLGSLFIHELDVPLVRSSYSASMLMERKPTRPISPENVTVLREGKRLPAACGLQWIREGEHSAGSIWLCSAERNLVFFGDSRRIPRLGTANRSLPRLGAHAAACLSLSRLRSVMADDAMLLPGHGAVAIVRGPS